jgi:hypothetical protein
MNKLTGKITHISEVTEKDDWAKLDFTVEEVGQQYPQSATFGLFKKGDWVKAVKEFQYKVGDNVEVEFKLQSKEWKDKRFNSVNAWKIDSISAIANNPSAKVEQLKDEFDLVPAEDSDDNLPF